MTQDCLIEKLNEIAPVNLKPEDNIKENKYKLIDYLIKRLEHTINHTQTLTKLIYFIDAAILAAVYFEFGKIRPLSYAFLIGGILTFMLCVVNILHAQFIAIQGAWYRTIDQEIRNVFLSLEGLHDIGLKYLGESIDEVLKTYKFNYLFFRAKRTHEIYVLLHVIVAILLFIFSVVFFYFWLNPPKLFIQS